VGRSKVEVAITYVKNETYWYRSLTFHNHLLQKYFFHIAYKGNRYHGWQYQPNVLSIQEVLETALSQILKERITVMGCGRTDAQVHATQYFFHIEVNAWNFDMMFRLNKLLPQDIAVYDIILVDEKQHARYDATLRTYDYFIHTYKNPFLSEGSSLYLEKNLNLAMMKRAAERFVGHKDFKAFHRGPTKYKNTLCNVSSAKLFIDATGDRIRFQVSSNRFLSSMVRTMVGTLLEIGRGEFAVEELENGIATRALPEFITPAYPQGLYLTKVIYPYLDIPTRTDFLPIIQLAEEDWVRI
jgi:tRNA pseudouridine38-40 synthase